MSQCRAVHLVAHTKYGEKPLVDRSHCALPWAKLRARFPLVLACIFMPDHIHLLLAIELRAFTRRVFPGKSLWQRLPAPEVVPDRHHLQRTIRYVHLNPCRAKLAHDPLEWEWSTHRDAVGAVATSWLAGSR